MFSEAELHRLRGELLQIQGVDEQEVESCFLQALAVAGGSRRPDRWNYVHPSALAACGYSRVNASKPDLLAGIYAWFTEAFTPTI